MWFVHGGCIHALKRAAVDWQYWLALAAGPLAWWLLYLAFKPDLSAAGLSWQRAAVLVLAYPLLEEFAFRGALQGWLLQTPRLVKRYGPLSFANLLTSLAFAAMHLLQHPPLWALSVLLPSLVFGYFRERHDTIATPFILHAFYNLGYFWLFPPGT